MSKEILCTLGPASVNAQVITRLEELGVNLFRINLSHTKVEDLPSLIQKIQSLTTVPICLDTEGAQIRTGDLKEGQAFISEKDEIKVVDYPVNGDKTCFNFTPVDVIHQFHVGDLVSIDFNSVLMQVIEKGKGFIKLRAINGGLMGEHKAVNLDVDVALDPLSHKDRKALAVGKEYGIKHVALSFANRASDVDEIRSIVGAEIFLISKIESKCALNNLEAIASKSDALLIDRGDLSRQVPIERIPPVQKQIIKVGKKSGVKVYVATNLLESMVIHAHPTRAEVNDIYNTLNDGADGLVLAAETAIGAHPIGCALMVRKLIDGYTNDQENCSITDLNFSSLIQPIRKKLHNSFLPQADQHSLDTFPKISVRDEDLVACVNIALGTFSPLNGFMNKQEFISVIESSKLPCGVTWSKPVILPISQESADNLRDHAQVVLTDSDGTVFAMLNSCEQFSLNLGEHSQQWLGTNDGEHSGVIKMKSMGDKFLSGKVTLLKKPLDLLPASSLTAEQCRLVFSQKGWGRVVGYFPTTDAMNFKFVLTPDVLKSVFADGVFLCPVLTGRGTPQQIEILKNIDSAVSENCGLSKDQIATSSIIIDSYNCIKRETLLKAICAENMGCSHFLLEDPDLVESFKNLKIRPIVPSQLSGGQMKADTNTQGVFVE